VTSLDISDNNIELLLPGQLPRGLKELRLTGCRCEALPESFTSLRRLEAVYAGANRLEEADTLFRLPAILHIGAGYNRIGRLPPAGVLAACNLVSLDVSHNDLAGLGRVLASLAMLPRLLNLSLRGNPCALAPSYGAVVPAALPGLLTLDGSKLEPPLASSSRPPPADVIAAAAADDDAGAPLLLTLSLNSIDVYEAPGILDKLYPPPPPPDPAAAVPPPAGPEPKAVLYHLEFELPDGSAVSSVAGRVAPPPPPEPPVDPKAKAKPPPPPKKGAPPVEEPPPPIPLARGAVTLTAELPPSVAGRDYLRSGVPVRLYRTYQLPSATEVTYMKELPPPKKGAPAPPPVEVTELQWAYSPAQACIGAGRLAAKGLLEGAAATAFLYLETADEPLFDPKNGVRLTLKPIVAAKQRTARALLTASLAEQ